MLKKLFNKKKDETRIVILAPITGKIIPLEDVPDIAFSQKLIGDGVAIIPDEGRVVSPVNGEVTMLFPTKHAIGIVTEQGLEILIHIGVETVGMKGEGFIAHVNIGDKVKVGDLLIEFSIDLINEKATSAVTPVLIINTDKIEKIEVGPNENVKMNESILMTLELKS